MPISVDYSQGSGLTLYKFDMTVPRSRSACVGRGVMRQFQITPPSQDIVHPICAKCGAPIWLTRIEPDEPGVEKRTL